jgi:hypothetical protein
MDRPCGFVCLSLHQDFAAAQRLRWAGDQFRVLQWLNSQCVLHTALLKLRVVSYVWR